jgi:RNA polymerase sigma factor (sigma-70 family)
LSVLIDSTKGIPTERSLVQDCIQKNRLAQKQLFEKYKDAMYATCYRILKDHDAAADTLQDAFLKVFANLSTFEFKSTLGTWIKTIVVRTAIRKLKEEMTFERLEDVAHKHMPQRATELTAYDLENAILCLPAGYRTVFLLIEVEGYKHKEVAEMLGVTEGTSKSQLHDARKLLQMKLKEFKDYGT